MEFQLDPFELWDIYLNDKNKKRRKAYFQEVHLKMMGKIWRDFIDDMTRLKIHADFFDWWDIVKANYIKIEKEINASTSQTKEWKRLEINQLIIQLILPLKKLRSTAKEQR